MHLCRKFSAAALLCAMLTYPFGQRGPNGNGFHVHSHSLIGDAVRESAFHQGPHLLFHPAPSLSFTRLPLSLFSSPSTSVFYLLLYCNHISYFIHSPSFSAPITLLSFLLQTSLHLFPSHLPSHILNFSPSSFMHLFINSLYSLSPL